MSAARPEALAADSCGRPVGAVAFAWMDVAVVLASCVVFLPAAVMRVVDVDEGVYGYAARLVGHGQLPYRDFFYEQMPLLPFVYGGWFRVFGASWYSARFLSALFAVAIGALLYMYVRDRLGRRQAVVALAVYMFTTSVWSWFPMIKTYALSTLLLFAALSIVSRRREETRSSRWFWSGLLLGLAVDTRLTFAAAAPIFAIAARSRRPWVGGLAIGLTPSVVLFVLEPRRFMFDNLGYHGVKTDNGLLGDFSDKGRVVERLLVGDGQFLLLVIGGIVAAAISWQLTRRIPLALGIAAALAVAGFVPTPSFTQYFCVLVPFLIAGISDTISDLKGATAHRAASIDVLGTTLGIAVGIYVLLSGFGFAHLVTDFSSDRTIGSVQRVTAVVERNTAPDESVLSSWPGFLFTSHALAVPRTADPFVSGAAERLSPEQIQKYDLVTASEIERMIASHRTRLVVFGEQKWVFGGLEREPRWRLSVTRARYARIARLSFADVYLAPVRARTSSG